MRNCLIALALLLLLPLPLSAAQAQPWTEPTPGPPLKLTVEFPDGGAEGDLVRAVFRVTNLDDRPLVLHDIRRSQFPWTVYTFQRALSGALEADERLGGYRYDPDAEGTTESFFSEGLLWPKQSVSVELLYRPLQRRESFELRWYQFCPCAVDRLFWVPERLTAAPGEQPEAFDPAALQVFVHIDQPAEQRLGQSAERSIKPDVRPSEWAVIFPVERLGDVDLKSGEISVRYQLTARRPDLDSALRRATTPPQQATFSDYFSAWVLSYPSYSLLVRSDGSTEIAPTSSTLFFDDLDSAGEVVVQVESEDRDLKAAFTVRKGDGERLVGQFISVPKARVDKLLSYAREHELLIEVERIGPDGHYFYLRGER